MKQIMEIICVERCQEIFLNEKARRITVCEKELKEEHLFIFAYICTKTLEGHSGYLGRLEGRRGSASLWVYIAVRSTLLVLTYANQGLKKVVILLVQNYANEG